MWGWTLRGWYIGLKIEEVDYLSIYPFGLEMVLLWWMTQNSAEIFCGETWKAQQNLSWEQYQASSFKCWPEEWGKAHGNGREGVFWLIQEFKWGVVPEDSDGEPYWYASTYNGDVGFQECISKLPHRQRGAL